MSKKTETATSGVDNRVVYNVTAEQFIVAWEQADSAEEVAEKLGMPKPIVHARASTYRQAGLLEIHRYTGEERVVCGSDIILFWRRGGTSPASRTERVPA